MISGIGPKQSASKTEKLGMVVVVCSGQNISSRLPINSLSYNQICVRDESDPNPLGIVPVNSLSGTEKKFNCFHSVPKDSGTLPEKLFTWIKNKTIFVHDENDSGIVPDKKLFVTWNVSSDVKEPNEDGNVPVNRFSAIENDSNRNKDPKDSGIVPLCFVCCRRESNQ